MRIIITHTKISKKIDGKWVKTVDSKKSMTVKEAVKLCK